MSMACCCLISTSLSVWKARVLWAEFASLGQHQQSCPVFVVVIIVRHRPGPSRIVVVVCTCVCVCVSRSERTSFGWWWRHSVAVSSSRSQLSALLEKEGISRSKQAGSKRRGRLGHLGKPAG